MKAQEQITYFAQSWTDSEVKIGLSEQERALSFLAIGASGSGKSTVLLLKIIQDLQRDRGLCLLDPHGDLAEAVLPWVPWRRRKHFIYLNASDTERPLGINLLEGAARDPQDRFLVVSNLMSVFEKFWRNSWGPRLAHVLRMCLLTLTQNPGSTLLGVNKLLNVKTYRDSLLQNVTDKLVLDFWAEEYEKYPAKFRAEVISPIQNKLSALLSNQTMRNILCQSKSSIQFEQLINQRGILIVNLAKGLIGEEPANLLGSLILSKLIITSMERVKLPPAKRHTYHVYVDEYHNMVASAELIATALSESRKFGLSLSLANQYLQQTDEKVRQAILANVGPLAVFQVDTEDAEQLGKLFGASWPWENLVKLKQYELYYRPSRASANQFPINAFTIPPPTPRPDASAYVKRLIEISRARYGRSLGRVERAIDHFYNLKVWPRYEAA